MNNTKNQFFIGTSSFSSKDWVGNFYPEKTLPSDYLVHYAEKLDTVEIDATYYAIPSARTVLGWKNKTPEGFIFAAKFPKAIVHCGEGPKPDPEKILVPEVCDPLRDSFLNVMAGLEEKLGPLLIQFPYFSKAVFPEKEIFLDRLDKFLGALPNNFRYAVEIRNKAWLNNSFAELCRTHNVALTLVDHAWMPHGDEIEKKFDPVTTDFSYIRLIGDRKGIEKITTSWEREVVDMGERIERWVGLIRRLIDRDLRIYTYANNHYAGHAPATVNRIQTLLNS